MKRIFVCVLLLLSLAASLLLPALAAPAQYTLSARGLAFLQEFESGATADSVKNCENAVNSFAKEKNVELTQTQFDALVSITYDIGSYTLGYRYGRTIAEGGYTAAELADAWCAWVNKSNGTGFSETPLSDLQAERRQAGGQHRPVLHGGRALRRTAHGCLRGKILRRLVYRDDGWSENT